MLLDVNDDESKKEAKATVPRRRRWWLLKAFLCLSNLFFCLSSSSLFCKSEKKLKKIDHFVNFILLSSILHSFITFISILDKY